MELTDSANAGTHEAPVVLQTHLPTGEKVRHCCDRFFRVLRAGTYCQDQIPKRKPDARPDDLTMLFHLVSVSIRSNSSAIVHCEYLVHAGRYSRWFIMHFRTDHHATVLFNFRTRKIHDPNVVPQPRWVCPEKSAFKSANRSAASVSATSPYKAQRTRLRRAKSRLIARE